MGGPASRGEEGARGPEVWAAVFSHPLLKPAEDWGPFPGPCFPHPGEARLATVKELTGWTAAVFIQGVSPRLDFLSVAPPSRGGKEPGSWPLGQAPGTADSPEELKASPSGLSTVTQPLKGQTSRSAVGWAGRACHICSTSSPSPGPSERFREGDSGLLGGKQ